MTSLAYRLALVVLFAGAWGAIDSVQNRIAPEKPSLKVAERPVPGPYDVQAKLSHPLPCDSGWLAQWGPGEMPRPRCVHASFITNHEETK